MLNATERIELADEPAFRLGPARVEPSARQVRGPDGVVHTLQPKTMQLLVALHRFAGQTVTRERLMDICWEGRIVGEDSLDRLLVQLRKLAADTEGAFTIETVRGVGLRLRTAGQSPPDDDAPAAEAGHSAEDERSAPGWPRALVFGIGLLLALALGVGLWSIRTAPEPSVASAPQPPSLAPDSRSLAVLPFRALSSGTDDDLLAGGITEEVTQAVAALPGVRVTARSSAEATRTAGLAADETARALGVSHLVEGAVRRAGNRIRVSARLVRAGDASVIWSSDWERDFGEDFDVAALIAAEVAANLEVVIDPAARAAMAQRGIGNVEAFIAFERGRRLYTDAHDSSGPQLLAGLEEARRAFDEAIALAPQVAEIHLWRSDLATHVILDWAGDVPAPMRARGLAWWKAELVADLDAAVAKSRPGGERAMAELQRTIVSDSWRGLAGKLALALRQDRCAEVSFLEEIQPLVRDRSIQLFYARQRGCDPLDVFVADFHLTAILADGEPEAALDAHARLSPELRGTRQVTLDQLRALMMLGRHDAARQLLDTSAALPPDRDIVRIERLRLLRLEGRTAEADALHAELAATTSTITRRLAMAAWAGDRPSAARIAAEIDAMPLGHLKLGYALALCLCGAAFPLEATPNFAARLAESGLSWPPPRRFPLPRATS